MKFQWSQHGIFALRRLRFFYRCAAAAGLVLSAYALRVAIEGWKPDGPAYAPFVPAVIVATGLLGLEQGLLAAVLGMPLAIYSFVEPVGSFQVDDWYDVANIVFLASLAISAAIIIELVLVAAEADNEN